MHLTVWLVKILGTLDSYRTEVWLCLLANPPPVKKPFPFGADSWSTQLSSNAECRKENSLHCSSPTGMSGAAPQETSCSNPAGSRESRECAPDGQHTLKKRSSAGLGVFVYYFDQSVTTAEPSQ